MSLLFFVSHHLTDKSDVYSFGVVLLELLTRKKPIYIDNLDVQKALSHTFIVMFQQKNLHDILDDDIIEDEAMVVLEKLAELAMHCLNPRGDERPTMKEVSERLQILRTIRNPMRMHYTDGESLILGGTLPTWS